jgi:hypothetical protein
MEVELSAAALAATMRLAATAGSWAAHCHGDLPADRPRHATRDRVRDLRCDATRHLNRLLIMNGLAYGVGHSLGEHLLLVAANRVRYFLRNALANHAADAVSASLSHLLRHHAADFVRACLGDLLRHHATRPVSNRLDLLLRHHVADLVRAGLRHFFGHHVALAIGDGFHPLLGNHATNPIGAGLRLRFTDVAANRIGHLLFYSFTLVTNAVDRPSRYLGNPSLLANRTRRALHFDHV